jgi:hypothetical protein
VIQRINQSKQWVLFLILGALIVGGITWVNYLYTTKNPGGEDFFVQYVGTRALIKERLSPYGNGIADRTKEIILQHSSEERESEIRFGYPLYASLFFFPFSLINNFFLARALWMTVLEIALVLNTFIVVNNSEWKPSLLIQGLLLVFSITWYCAVNAVAEGNTAVLVVLFISTSIYLIKNNRDQLAGILLAIATIKPILSFLLLPYVVIWAIYHKRWHLVSWLFGTIVVLCVIGAIFIPNWMIQYTWEVLRFTAQSNANTLNSIISEWNLGMNILYILAGLGIVLILEWWLGRKNRFERFLWIICLTMVINLWIGIPSDPGDLVMLFPALVLVLSAWSKRWESKKSIITGSVLAVIFFGLWILIIMTSGQKEYWLIRQAIIYILAPGFIIIGLYWIKWWVGKPVSSLWS